VDAYTVIADVPGVSKEQLTIKLLQRTPKQPATLLIAGTRKPLGATAADGPAATADANTSSGDQQQLLLKERRRGQFERRVPLPDDAANAGISAKVREGVLTVKVPRVQMPPEQAERDIPIA